MYIEFVGCSGAGKSTLIKAVIARLQSKNIQYCSNHHSHFSLFGSGWRGLRNPTLQNLVCDTQGLIRNWRHAESMKFIKFSNFLLKNYVAKSVTRINLLRSVSRKLGIHNYVQSQQQHRPQSQLTLIDEGIIQSAHNSLVFPNTFPSNGEITSFVNLVPKPELIVYVKTPQDTLIERALQRHDKPIGGSPEKLVSFIKNGHQVFQSIFHSDQLGENVICIDTDIYGDMDEAVEYILNQLQKISAVR